MTPKEIGYYPRASLGFVNSSDTNLIAFTRNVVTLMADDIVEYPTPSPTLAVITTSVDGFEVKVQEAFDGGRIAIATRKAARAGLVSLLKEEAAYVTGNCKGNVVTLLNSGFKAVKTPSPAGILPAPENVRFEPSSISGQLWLRFKRVYNANNYTVQTALDPEGPWQDFGIPTSTRVSVTNLTPGKAYWARVRANGSQGPSGWGGPATAMAV